jgi:hypothetical protein
MQALGSWGGPEDRFEIAALDEEDGALSGTLTAHDGTTISVEQAAGDPRVRFGCRLAIPAAVGGSEDTDTLVRLLDLGRPGSVSIVRTGDEIEVTATVYEDGFSRHSANIAIADCERAAALTRERLDGLVEAAEAHEQAKAEFEAADRELAEARTEAQRAAADEAAAAQREAEAAVEQAQAEAEEAQRALDEASAPVETAGPAADDIPPPPAPPPEEPGGGFAPTHLVPSGGLRAWASPDPEAPPVTELDAGVELQIIEQAGAWARVAASNGWTGWVDGRRLQAR